MGIAGSFFRQRFHLVAALFCASILAGAQTPAANPKVKAIVDEVSDERIAAILKKLESFGTRNPLSAKSLVARDWIASELRSYSPRLEVSFDSYKVKKAGRLTHDVELHNVIAVLPGTINKDRQVLISAHWDSMVMRTPTGGGTPGADIQPLDPDSPAPGVTDDGSGTAAVMELARVMSKREFEKTLVFVLFTAEEEGLIGSSLFASKAKAEKRQIEAVLNNDIIGSTISGNGEVDNHTVRIFSEDPADSPSRQLARYIRDAAERYVPNMTVDLVFRSDRFGRGGDHTPMNQEGFAAVRVSAAEEDYAHQHTATDTFENTDVPYIGRVARVNGAAAASLALAPKAPLVMEEIQRGERKGQLTAMIGRGRSRYDAQVRWKTDNAEADIAGYVVLMRSTTSPFWERRIAAGKVTELTLPGVSVDEYVFAVQAVDQDGNESLAAPYVLLPRQRAKIETFN